MKKIFFLALITLNQLHAADQEHKSSAAQTTEIEQLAQELIEKYKPTKERCGAAAHEKLNPNAPETKRITTAEGQLSCMISGFKNVFWGNENILNNPTLRDLLDAHSIGSLTINVKFGDNFILYTLEGKQYAELLKKYFEELEQPSGEKIFKHRNNYLIGILLGYDSKDIEYFYMFNKNRGLPNGEFEEDKKAAQEWLIKNTKE